MVRARIVRFHREGVVERLGTVDRVLPRGEDATAVQRLLPGKQAGSSSFIS